MLLTDETGHLEARAEIRVVRAAFEEARTASGPPGESADVGTSKDPPGCPGVLPWLIRMIAAFA